MGVIMKFIINNQEYDVVIIKKNNKNTYIRVKEDMKIYVTTNIFATKSYIKKLLQDNYKAIEKMLLTVSKKNEKNNLFFYLGNSYDIIVISTIDNVDIDDENHIIYVKDLKQLDKWYVNEIKKLFYQRFISVFEQFQEATKLPSLRIRKMKTRWGVYNRVNHTVTLNSELMKYDIKCLDYVITHELSHIIHFDHSKKFWELVSKYCPDYKKIKKFLKE